MYSYCKKYNKKLDKNFSANVMRLGTYLALIVMVLITSQSYAKSSLKNHSEEAKPEFNVSIPKCVICEEGYRLTASRQYKAAGRFWREIIEAKSKKPTVVAIALQQMASIHQIRGRYPLANNHLHLAINTLKDTEANALLGSIYYQLAVLDIRQGHLKAAKQSLQQVMSLIDFKTNSSANSVVHNKIGELYSRQDEPDKAIVHYIESFNEFLTNNDNVGAMAAARNTVMSAIALHRYQEAVDIFSRALVLVETQSSQDFGTTVKVSLLDVLNTFPSEEVQKISVKLVHAVLLLKKIAQSPKHSNYNQVYALSVLAEIYYRAGQLEQAQLVLNKAIIQAQHLEADDLVVRVLMLSGKIHRSKGETDRSIQAYQLAVNHSIQASEYTFEPLYQILQRSISQRNGNKVDSELLYLDLADLLLTKAREDKNRMSKRRLLLQVRDTLERQKVSELQNYYQNSCDIPTQSKKVNIDNIIDNNSVAIYPIILPGRIEVLASFSDEIRQYQFAIDSAMVEAVVNKFRSNLEELNTNAYLIQAQQIYRWLIQPLEPELRNRGVNTIVVVAEKMFRTIPLSVLHDGKRFLVEKYALSVVPGLQLIDPQPLDRKNIRVLLSGISDAVQGYPPLRYVQGELEEIQDLYVTTLLLNNEFITKNFEREMRNTEFTIAHLASHSEFKGNIEDSYILTFDGKMSMQRLGDITSVARNHDQPIELLTLSACQTAVGDDKAALGLAGVAIKAGARSALATLWSIDDFASSVLVSEFYKQLSDQSISKAKALQRAQLKLISSRRFDHPAYWSSFLLIGNWL